MLINPKTNWTSDDFYNFQDINKVEANIQIVANYLESIGYTIPLEGVVNNRDMLSIDFISGINRLERNLDSIREHMVTPPSYGDMKVWANKIGFNFDDANRYEKNLMLLYKWAQLIFESYTYCGTFSCGEEVI